MTHSDGESEVHAEVHEVYTWWDCLEHNSIKTWYTDLPVTWRWLVFTGSTFCHMQRLTTACAEIETLL